MSFHKIPKDDTQHQTHLDSAVKVLSGDLQEEASRAGLDNILQRWIEDVKDADNPALHPVVTDLQELKAHFGSGTLDPAVIGRLLKRLGNNTLQAAVFAENPNTSSRVTQLGEALLAASNQVLHAQTSPEEDLQRDSAEDK